MLLVQSELGIDLFGALRSIITTVVNEAEKLAQGRYTGVIDCGTHFRIHKAAIVPMSLDIQGVNDEIKRVVHESFNPKHVQWDNESLWLTVHRMIG